MRHFSPLAHIKLRAFIMGVAFTGGMFDAPAIGALLLVAILGWSFWDEQQWINRG